VVRVYWTMHRTFVLTCWRGGCQQLSIESTASSLRCRGILSVGRDVNDLGFLIQTADGICSLLGRSLDTMLYCYGCCLSRRIESLSFVLSWIKGFSSLQVSDSCFIRRLSRQRSFSYGSSGLSKQSVEGFVFHGRRRSSMGSSRRKRWSGSLCWSMTHDGS
jgi:hypothetical protein